MSHYVKTPEELKRIEEMLAPSRFLCDVLTIDFKTSWEFARENLPPCFEPIGDEAAGTADAFCYIVSYESPYCGEFDGAILALLCTYEDKVGYLMMTEYMGGNNPANGLAVTIGREIWGEVKREGVGRVYRDGSRYYAFAQRHGVRTMEIEAEVGPDLGPRSDHVYDFEIKAIPHATGKGLQYDPLLIIFDVNSEYTSYREGSGRLKLQGTPYDRTDWPIVEVGLAKAFTCESCYPYHSEVNLKDRELYAPYVWGRGFDDPTLYRIPSRYQDVVPTNWELLPEIPQGEWHETSVLALAK